MPCIPHSRDTTKCTLDASWENCTSKMHNTWMIEKIFNSKKRGMGIESKKYANKLEIRKVWKQVKDGAQ